VTALQFNKPLGVLAIGLDFPRGSRFACPVEGCRKPACPVRDTIEKRWRHLDLLERQVFLTARVPRVDCPGHGVHLVAVFYARPGSGFTLFMEVAMLTFAKQMPITPLASMAREHDTRVRRVIEHHVHTARLEARRVMFATTGNDAETVKAFAGGLAAHGGEPTTQLEEVCCDMSPTSIAGIASYLAEQPERTETQLQAKATRRCTGRA